MFFQNSQDKTKLNEKKLKEFIIKSDALTKEINGFYTEIGICPKKLAEFTSNKENFVPNAWEELQKQRKMLDEKLTFQIDDIRNPVQTKNRYEDRNIPRHWIPVR